MKKLRITKDSFPRLPRQEMAELRLRARQHPSHCAEPPLTCTRRVRGKRRIDRCTWAAQAFGTGPAEQGGVGRGERQPGSGSWAAPETSRKWASGAGEFEAGSRGPGNRDVGLTVPTTLAFSLLQATLASGPCAYAVPSHVMLLPWLTLSPPRVC